MTQRTRSHWEKASWVLAFVLGCIGMYGATQTDRANAKRDAQLAATQHTLALKMQEEAVAREEATHQFIDEFDYPVAMLDKQGAVVEWNDAAEREFGWTKEDLQANGIASIMPEEMRARHHSAFAKAMVGSGKVIGRKDAPVQRVECTIIHKDRRRNPIPVEVSVRVHEEADGDMYALAHIDRQKNIVHVDAQEGSP